MAAISVRVQREDFAVEQVMRELRQSAPGAGAIVTFTGLCRSEGGRLAALELEHYPGMAEREIEDIAAQAADRWPVEAIAVIHRFGRIPAGANIVLVAAAAQHRRAAFSAADFVMDFLKTRAPFWKKEHLATAADGEWVAADERDDAAAGRWTRTG